MTAYNIVVAWPDGHTVTIRDVHPGSLELAGVYVRHLDEQHRDERADNTRREGS